MDDHEPRNYVSPPHAPIEFLVTENRPTREV